MGHASTVQWLENRVNPPAHQCLISKAGTLLAAVPGTGDKDQVSSLFYHPFPRSLSPPFHSVYFPGLLSGLKTAVLRAAVSLFHAHLLARLKSSESCRGLYKSTMTLSMETENELGDGCLTVPLQGAGGPPANPGSLGQTPTPPVPSPHSGMCPAHWDASSIIPSGLKPVSLTQSLAIF